MSRIIAICLCTVALCVRSTAVFSADYDETVSQAQQALKARGYDPGVVDGLWGKQTEEAIKKFQHSKGFPISGTLDEQTKAGLGLRENGRSGLKKSEGLEEKLQNLWSGPRHVLAVQNTSDNLLVSFSTEAIKEIIGRKISLKEGYRISVEKKGKGDLEKRADLLISQQKQILMSGEEIVLTNNDQSAVIVSKVGKTNKVVTIEVSKVVRSVNDN